MPGRLAINQVILLRSLYSSRSALLNPKISGIIEHALLVAVRKKVNVMNVSDRRDDAVSQAGYIIDADLHFHSKVPLVAFWDWRLSGSRMPLSFFVELGAEMAKHLQCMPSCSAKPFFSK